MARFPEGEMTLTRGGSKGVMDVRECRLLIDGKWIGASLAGKL
jgi:hypothetical protein